MQLDNSPSLKNAHFERKEQLVLQTEMTNQHLSFELQDRQWLPLLSGIQRVSSEMIEAF